MITFTFNREKGISALVYIASKLGNDKADLHSVIKALYFAEKKHLAKYGRPITGDEYHALPDGPVPTTLYDLCKDVRKQGIMLDKSLLVSKDSMISPTAEANLDEFSETDIECLDEAIKEVDGSTYKIRKEKSHDQAYEIAWAKRSGCRSSRINFLDIAIAGGADKEMQEFLKDQSEFSNAFC